MPIVVEFLQSATYQDQADLQKIYRDAPSWLFTPFADAVQLVESCLEETTLVVARFNDRLVAAARLQRHDVVWELSHLCVRNPTRRRGFAEQLINEVRKSARESGCELRLLATAEPPEVQALAAKLQMPLVLY
ncbi:acetyl-CoA sensor PanZ family protein [Pseudomonas folii]|uniref:Acetyl-CoA sensor PanZ family protein n=1 Tax=Pseudomonas folii TaxID=2762593 RepID=A0ABR7B2R9_9PSED|nr:acetyl-CoA sensor PanZ family protein [Pseudomonas folii]MBC3951480.1 acetyl-CoA sensor PanZ family protein [Pseudomonas folii]